MAVTFRAAQVRGMWVASIVALLTDYLIVLGILLALGVGNSAWMWAVGWTFLLEIGLALYGLLSFLRRLAWYYVVEREQRIQLVTDELLRLHLPTPASFYGDCDAYLANAAMSKEVPLEGRSYASMLLGVLASQRQVGPRSEALLTAMTIEAAIQRLPSGQIETTFDEDVPEFEEEAPRETEDFVFRFDINPQPRSDG